MVVFSEKDHSSGQLARRIMHRFRLLFLMLVITPVTMSVRRSMIIGKENTLAVKIMAQNTAPTLLPTPKNNTISFQCHSLTG